MSILPPANPATTAPDRAARTQQAGAGTLVFVPEVAARHAAVDDLPRDIHFCVEQSVKSGLDAGRV